MRTVIVPEPVILYDLSQNPPRPLEDGDKNNVTFSMHTFLMRIVIPDPAFGKGYKADRARVALDKIFRNAEPGASIPVEDEHLDFARKTIENPQGDYPGQLRMQLLPFQDALLEAK